MKRMEYLDVEGSVQIEYPASSVEVEGPVTIFLCFLGLGLVGRFAILLGPSGSTALEILISVLDFLGTGLDE